MFYISVFFQYASQYLKTRLTYRVDTVIEILSDLLIQGVNLVFILVVFGHTQFLNGWNRDEIIFIYGFFLVPYALFSAFFNIWDFNERYIVKGELDRVVTRPVHSLFQIIMETDGTGIIIWSFYRPCHHGIFCNGSMLIF